MVRKGRKRDSITEKVVESEAESNDHYLEPEVVEPSVVPDDEPTPISASDEDSASDDDVDTDTPSAKGVKDLVRYDSLQAYLQEIAHHPSLSREEEHAIAVRYYEKGDIDAAYKLVLANLRLVVMIAREYQRAARSLLDLIQEGNIGLMEAVKNYDPYRNVRFPSYAVWWIRAYIIRFVIANWRLVKIGTTQAQRKLFFNLQKEKEKLERMGFWAEPKLIAQNLDVRESDVLEMEQRLSSPDVSVDAPLADGDNDSSLHTILPSDSLSAEEILSRFEINSQIKDSFEEFAATLDPKESAIFRERLLNEEKATLQELSERFLVSRERIRQIEEKVKKKLKDFLLKRLGESFFQFRN